MTRHPLDPDRNLTELNNKQHKDASELQQETDQAWDKLQAMLADEKPHPNWQTWSSEELHISSTIPSSSNMKGMNTNMNSTKKTMASPSAPAEASKKRRSFMNSNRRKWAAGIAACALVGTVLATPLGNNALASIMNEFRMQEIASVNEQGLEDMADKYAQTGLGNEDRNRFGTFIDTEGTVKGDFSAKEAAEKLGYPYIDTTVLGMSSEKKVYVSPARTQTINLNVDEVNKAIQQMGGKDLLPQSMNQKEISFTLPATISYDLTMEDNPDTSKWVSLNQSGLPIFKLDESIDAEEAYNALINLPFMPNDLKQAVQKEKFLNGNIPMPVLSYDSGEKVTIDGVPVIITNITYDDEGTTKNLYYRAFWIKDNQLFDLEGNKYANHDELKQQIKEIIQS